MISLIGIPYDDSSSFLKGPAKAPDLIRDALLSPSTNTSIENGLEFSAECIRDAGNLNFTDESGHFDLISDAISAELDRGFRTLALGGDHSITYPIVREYAKRCQELTIIQFDAHPDIYDSFEGDRYSHACPFARILEQFEHVNLTQIGIRTMNDASRLQVERFGVRLFEMRDRPASSALEVKGPVYISLDIDVLDPAFAPGVSHHEPGGFSVRELITMIQSISNRIVGADVVEYNPKRDINGVTAMVAAKLTKELAGIMIKNG